MGARWPGETDGLNCLYSGGGSSKMARWALTSPLHSKGDHVQCGIPLTRALGRAGSSACHPAGNPAMAVIRVT
jgi:hypothetical protein